MRLVFYLLQLGVQLSKGFSECGQSFGEELGCRVLCGPGDFAEFVAWRSRPRALLCAHCDQPILPTQLYVHAQRYTDATGNPRL